MKNEPFQPGLLVNMVSHPQLAIPARRLDAGTPHEPDPRPLPDPAALHPWGRMDEILETQMGAALIPIDWRMKEGEFPTPDQWNAWVDERVKEIDYLLWPEFKPKIPSAWNLQRVANLITADFCLLADLHDNLELPIAAIHPTQVFHEQLFNEEDAADIPFGTGYDRYDPTLSERALTELPDILAGGIADKVGTLHLQLKKRFQRPRAHQVALLQDRQDFKYRWGRTGNTPSMLSGHCLQACLAGCAAFVALHTELGDNTKSITSLAQLTVDIGDRRVYAGVHYPSDNLASWLVALHLVTLVFDKDESLLRPGQFLWQAISRRSDVYRAIERHEARHKGSPYASVLAALQTLGKKLDPEGSDPGARDKGPGILPRTVFT